MMRDPRISIVGPKRRTKVMVKKFGGVDDDNDMGLDDNEVIIEGMVKVEDKVMLKV